MRDTRWGGRLRAVRRLHRPYARRVELRHLRYFVAVADERSITKAAGRVHVAQPALSAQLKQLETELGVELLIRSSRGVELTRAGMLLFHEVVRILDDLDHATSLVRDVGNGVVGRLRVGAVSSAPHPVVPAALADFARRFPRVGLTMQEMDPDAIAAGVRDGDLDVGFLYLSATPEFDTTVVSSEPLVLAVPRRHRLAGQRRVELAALSRERFLLPPDGEVPGVHAAIMDACRRAGFTPRAAQHDVWGLQMVMALVGSGAGVALVSGSFRALDRPDVRFLTLDGTAATVDLAAIWRPPVQLPALRSLLDVLASGPVTATGGEASNVAHLPTAQW